jgi:WD40 repeat protein
LTFSHDGALLATAGRDGSASLWGVRERRKLKSFGPHFGAIRSIGFATDDRTLATGGTDGLVCTWDLGGVLEPQ